MDQYSDIAYNITVTKVKHKSDVEQMGGSVKDCSISNANAVGILQSCAKPLKWHFTPHHHGRAMGCLLYFGENGTYMKRSSQYICRSRSRVWFNIEVKSYRYREAHCGDQLILWLSYLHNRISCTGKTSSLYWIMVFCWMYQIIWWSATDNYISDLQMDKTKIYKIWLCCQYPGQTSLATNGSLWPPREQLRRYL